MGEVCRCAKRAAAVLARADSARRDAALTAIAAGLIARSDEVLQANAQDMQAGREAGLSDALLDRLALDEGRIEGIADAVLAIVSLPDPVGEVIEGRRLANGLDVRKVRVPLGVVAVVYEARPNVTIDAAALCLKSGNAIVLRGSSSAAHSNAALAQIAADGVATAGLPEGCVGLLAGGGREELAELATESDAVDLIIPRGGEGLKAALQEVATVPVIYAASGNCHVYVDAHADLDDAEAIVLNAKVQRPGVCNAAETLLVHEQIAAEFVPQDRRVAARGGRAAARRRARSRRWPASPPARCSPQARRTGRREYLALSLAVGVVDSVQDAIEHIARTAAGTPRRSSRATRPARAPFSSASTPRASTSTPRRASPTAARWAWARRSATPPRSSTRADRSACASCARSSTSSRATGILAADRAPWRASASSAGRSTRHTSDISRSRAARRTSWRWTASC